MNRQAILSVVLIAAAVAITFVMIALRPVPEEQEPVAIAPLVETVEYTVGAGDIEVNGSGTVQSREEVALGAEISGKLVFVNPAFREGSMVGGGAVLFRIDPADYLNRVRSAQADVAAQDVAVLQAQEEVAIAQDELQRFAEREKSRTTLSQSVDSNDYSARILPPGSLPSSSRAIGAASAAPNQLATREPQLHSAEAARERAAAQLADARLALQRTDVRSPFTGLVRSENTSIGTLVQPGQVLGTIVSTDEFEVRVSLTEAEAALIPGMFGARRSRIPAQVFFDYGGQTYRWSAFVDRADAILDPETRTIDVFLRVPRPLRGGVPVESNDEAIGSPPPLLLGSFVRVTITGSSNLAFATIPIDALRPDNQVWIVRDGKLRIVKVRVIQRNDRTAYVSAEGLGEGGRVVVSPLRTPVEGMDVRAEGSVPARPATPQKDPAGD